MLELKEILGSSATAFSDLFPLNSKGKALGTRLGAKKLRYFTASEIASLLYSIKLLCKYVKSDKWKWRLRNQLQYYEV